MKTDQELIEHLTEENYQLTLEVTRLLAALNRIALLGSGELAYTSEFTNEVNTIVRGALNEQEKSPNRQVQ